MSERQVLGALMLAVFVVGFIAFIARDTGQSFKAVAIQIGCVFGAMGFLGLALILLFGIKS